MIKSAGASPVVVGMYWISCISVLEDDLAGVAARCRDLERRMSVMLIERRPLPRSRSPAGFQAAQQVSPRLRRWPQHFGLSGRNSTAHRIDELPRVEIELAAVRSSSPRLLTGPAASARHQVACLM